METRMIFRSIMAERRGFASGTAERDYRTRAARKLVWIMRGKPVNEWVQA